MLLYVLTTDGYSNEDGNVYYAGYLLVNADESHRAAVSADIAELVGGEIKHGDVRVDTEVGYDGLFADEDQLVLELALRGWQATRVMNPTHIVHYTG